MTERMTKTERDDLQRLIRMRERVLKSEAQKRSAVMLSEFERQISAIYSFDDDQVWQEAALRAIAAVEDATRIIADRCAELGIPPEFAPRINFDWYGRGQNALDGRRKEIRTAAKAKIAATEKEAIARIERLSLDAQTEVLANGLVSDAANQFLKNMPPIETLMPPINAEELRAVVDARHKRHDDSSY